MKPYKDYQESFLKRLKEPSEAAAYINAAIETGDTQDFLVAVRNVVAAHGNLAHVAREAHVPRSHLYDVLGKRGNPELSTLARLLRSIGLGLAVSPVRLSIKHPKRHLAAA